MLRVLILTTMLFAGTAIADPFDFSYSGRITDASGVPASGPVTLEVKFFTAASGGSQIGPTKTVSDVPVTQGLFQTNIGLSAQDRAEVFSGNGDVWIEVIEVTTSKKFPRQKFQAIPFALRVPVDGNTLGWTSSGELKVLEGASVSKIDGTNVDASGATSGQVLTWNNSTSTWEPSDISTTTITNDSIGADKLAENSVGPSELDNTLCSNNQILKMIGGEWTCSADDGAGSALSDGGNNDGESIEVGTQDTFDLNFMTDNVNRMTIDTSGNVGIGTTAPSEKLHIFGDGGGTTLTFDSYADFASPSIVGRRAMNTAASPTVPVDGKNTMAITGETWDGNTFEQSAQILLRTKGTSSDQDTPGEIWLRTTPDGSDTLATRVVITEDGKVGIGTAAPSSKLQILSEGDGIYLDRYGSVFNSQPTFMMRRSRGTELSPLSVASGDVLGRYGFRGHNGTTFTTSAQAGMSAYAEESYTLTDNGTALAFETTDLGTTLQTEKVRITASGNVGIGTTAPAGLLDVDGSICISGDCITTWPEAISGSNIAFDGDSARSVGINRHPTADTAGTNLNVAAGGATSNATDKAGGDLVLSSGIATGTGGSEINFQTATPSGSGTADNTPTTKMTIDANGSVGIGTTGPENRLHIVDDDAAAKIEVNGNTATRRTALILKRSRADGVAPVADFGPTLNFQAEGATDGSVGEVAKLTAAWEVDQTNDTTDRDSYLRIALRRDDAEFEAMRVASSGNVGIGTTLPLSRLHVANGAGVTPNPSTDFLISDIASGTAVMSLLSSTVGQSEIYFGDVTDNQNGVIRAFGASHATRARDIDFAVNGAPRLTLDSTGNVGIGSISPAAPLDVNGSIKVLTSGTAIYNGGTASGSPTIDGFRISQQNDYFGVTQDALVIEKTDGNNNDPDGGIAFANTGMDGVVATAMVIKGDGNVGIGTTAPSSLLELNGYDAVLTINDLNGGSGRPGIKFTNNFLHTFTGDDVTDEVFGFYSEFSDSRTFDAAVRVYGKSADYGKYTEITHDGTNGILTTDVGNLLLSPAGNVGIGSTNPSEKLDVVGNVQVSGNIGLNIQLVLCSEGDPCDQDGDGDSVEADCPAGYHVTGCTESCAAGGGNSLRVCSTNVVFPLTCNNRCLKDDGSNCSTQTLTLICMRLTDIGDL